MSRLFTLAAALLLAPAVSASEIVPSQPTAFQDVNLRMTVDSCAFQPGSVNVSAVANTLRVTQQLNNCLVAGAPKVADIRLGALPMGTYRVEVYGTQQPMGTPIQTLAFEVTGRVEIAVFPPPARPLTDYTGLWWTPEEGGWGLSLHQGVLDTLFGSLFVYDASGQATWYSIQPGGWTSYTRWQGNVFRTTGPYFAGPGYDPRLVLVLPVGTATLDFEQAPGNVGRATFTYSVNGVTTTKTISRLAL